MKIFASLLLCAVAQSVLAGPSLLLFRNTVDTDAASGEEVPGCQWELGDVAQKRTTVFLKTKGCPEMAAWNFADHKVYFVTSPEGEVMEAGWPSSAAFSEKSIRPSELGGIEKLYVDRGTNLLKVLSRKLGTTTIQTHEYQGGGKWKQSESQQNSVVADKALNPAESPRNFSHSAKIGAELRAVSRPNLRIPASVKKRFAHCLSQDKKGRECVYLAVPGKRGVLMSFEQRDGGFPVPPLFYCYDDCKQKTELKNDAWVDKGFRLVSVRGDYLRVDRLIYKFGQTKPHWELPGDETGMEPVWFE